MICFAQLNENNEVIFVSIGLPENDGKEKEISKQTGERYLQASYYTHGGIYYDPETDEPAEDQSKAFRKNYPGIGYTYDEERDAFIPPKIFDSWILDEESCLWIAPIPYPEDGMDYIWDEESVSWVLLEED